MSAREPIARRPLREDVRERIIELIVSGAFPPGARVKEIELSERLGVSRTPIREALLGLEQDGFVRTDLARGFSILPLSADEARDLYPIIWTLESLALDLSDPAEVPVEELRRLAGRMRTSRASTKSRDLDRRWHAALLSACRNVRLLELIDGVKLRAQRYELAYMNDGGRVRDSMEHHAAIADALERGDRRKAVRIVREHWMFGMQTLLDWLEARDPAPRRQGRKTAR